jgi:hypothetical protein
VVLAEIRGEELDFQYVKTSVKSEIKIHIERIIIDAFYYNCFFAIGELIDLANHLGHDLEECAQIAYDKISKRTGKTIDGQFYKD